MNVQRVTLYFAFSMVCSILSIGLNATSIYFVNKSDYEIKITSAPWSGIVPYGLVGSKVLMPAGNTVSFDLTIGATYTKDTAAVPEVTLKPGDAFNKYVYWTEGITSIGVKLVNIAGPVDNYVKLVGSHDEEYIPDDRGEIVLNVPKGQIWTLWIKNK